MYVDYIFIISNAKNNSIIICWLRDLSLKNEIFDVQIQASYNLRLGLVGL